jgi:uroporphyrinogen decarboxylase
MRRPPFEPDFENLKTVLMGGKGRRVPNIELVIDREIRDGFLGRPCVTLADDIEFRYRAGYDYAWISVGMIDPAGTVNRERVIKSAERHFEGKDDRVWAETHGGVIRDRGDLEAYPWPDPERIDYSPFVEARKFLRPGMKIIAVLGKVFTAAWQLVGFERFCELIYDDPDFVAALVRRVGDIQAAVCERVAGMETVGAVFVPDDIAYHSGTMLPPKWFVDHVFTHYAGMARTCRRAGKPFIYHSDGNMSAMIDTIIDTGFDALHPIEPESMDIYELRKRVGTKLCLLGNIRVHTLSTGTPAEIWDLVKDRITNLGYAGAYCVGSSNSIPNYVPLSNYLAMLDASAEFAEAPK